MVGHEGEGMGMRVRTCGQVHGMDMRARTCGRGHEHEGEGTRSRAWGRGHRQHGRGGMKERERAERRRRMSA